MLDAGKIIVLGFALSVGVSYLFAWTGPTAPPPEGNVAAPVNVSSNAQAKLGGLSLGTTVLPIAPALFRVDCPSNDCIGKVLTATDNNGNVVWQDVPPTQSVQCTNVGTTSFVSLNGNNSGNNNSIVVNIGTLTAGTYTFTGSGQTYNSGGGGWAGVIIDSSPNFTLGDASWVSMINSTYGGNPATSGTGPSYRFYYNNDNVNTIVMLKRNGYNEASFTVPSTSITLAGTKYMYIVLTQAAISGSLTIEGTQNICAGGGGNPITILGPLAYTVSTDFNKEGRFTLNQAGKVQIVAYANTCVGGDSGDPGSVFLDVDGTRYDFAYLKDSSGGAGCHGETLATPQTTFLSGQHNVSVHTYNQNQYFTSHVAYGNNPTPVDIYVYCTNCSQP